MSDEWTTVTRKKPSTGPKVAKEISVSPVPAVYDSDTVVFRKNIKTSYKVEKGTAPNSSRNLNVSQFQRRVEAESEEGITQRKLYPEAFRLKVIKCRENQKLTQKQLAQKLNLPESVLKNIENKTGTYEPTVVSKISIYLNRLAQTQVQG